METFARISCTVLTHDASENAELYPLFSLFPGAFQLLFNTHVPHGFT